MKHTFGTRDMRVLMAEDDPIDLKFFRRALKGSALLEKIDVVIDGQEALDRIEGAHQLGIQMPNLILLDINMPRKNGLEVLAELKSKPSLRHIPVIIVSSSTNEDDLLKAYQLGASGFIMKTDNLIEFSNALQTLEAYWTRVVVSP